MSIKGALDLIDHQQHDSDQYDEEVKAQMKLSKQEIEMQAQVKSKMKYAGETYHRVAPASVEISKKQLGLFKTIL